MNYVRIIPRDLFNEANLLKCLGALGLWPNIGAISLVPVRHEAGPASGECICRIQVPSKGQSWLACKHRVDTRAVI